VLTKPTKLVDKATGAFREEQLVQINHPDLFTPVQGSVLLEATQKPFEVGNYELAGDSIESGEYGRPSFRLKIGKRIDPVKKAA
jgi:hypothetical protein